MAYYGNILEEELKNKVAQDLFAGFDTTQIIGRVDFCVSIPADLRDKKQTLFTRRDNYSCNRRWVCSSRLSR